MHFEDARYECEQCFNLNDLIAANLLPDGVIERLQRLDSRGLIEQPVKTVEPRGSRLAHYQFRLARPLPSPLAREPDRPNTCSAPHSGRSPRFFLDALLLVFAAFELLKELRHQFVTPVQELAKDHQVDNRTSPVTRNVGA